VLNRIEIGSDVVADHAPNGRRVGLGEQRCGSAAAGRDDVDAGRVYVRQSPQLFGRGGDGVSLGQPEGLRGRSARVIACGAGI